MRGCGSELEYNVEHFSECGFLFASHYIFITINLKPEKKKEMLIINSKINPCYVMVNLNLTEVFSTKTSSHQIRNTILKCSLATVKI